MALRILQQKINHLQFDWLIFDNSKQFFDCLSVFTFTNTKLPCEFRPTVCFTHLYVSSLFLAPVINNHVSVNSRPDHPPRAKPPGNFLMGGFLIPRAKKSSKPPGNFLMGGFLIPRAKKSSKPPPPGPIKTSSLLAHKHMKRVVIHLSRGGGTSVIFIRVRADLMVKPNSV